MNVIEAYHKRLEVIKSLISRADLEESLHLLGEEPLRHCVLNEANKVTIATQFQFLVDTVDGIYLKYVGNRRICTWIYTRKRFLLDAATYLAADIIRQCDSDVMFKHVYESTVKGLIASLNSDVDLLNALLTLKNNPENKSEEELKKDNLNDYELSDNGRLNELMDTFRKENPLPEPIKIWCTTTTPGLINPYDCDTCPNRPNPDKPVFGDTPCTWCPKRQVTCGVDTNKFTCYTNSDINGTDGVTLWSNAEVK